MLENILGSISTHKIGLKFFMNSILRISILRETNEFKGAIIGGHHINYVLSEDKLQYLLVTVVESSKQSGLSINYKKTECMANSK